MASVEIPLHADPQAYAPKPVFGKFTYRNALTILAVVLVEAPIVYALFKLRPDIPVELIAVLCAIPAIPVALVGISQHHGLYFEKWFPAVRRETKTPVELGTDVPRVVLHGMPAQKKPTREERKQARADKRESKKARPVEATEDAELAEAFIKRFGREMEPAKKKSWFKRR